MPKFCTEEVGFRDDLDLAPFFPEGGHDLACQVGFPGARVARQQQASAFEAVEHGVFRDLPVHRAAVRTLGLDSGGSGTGPRGP